MKNRMKVLACIFAAAITVVGCEGLGGGAEPTPEVVELNLGDNTGTAATEATDGTPTEEVVEDEPVPDGMYRSELTNEIISEDLKDQRPVAIMVDNETYAFPHIGLNKADVVYEIMNSTANGRITRLMCLVKDWKNIEQFGSVRSTRPTNFMLAGDWNAILCHDGGPVIYINSFVAKDYTDNLSGGFARFSNGKATEFTEYVTSNDYTNPSTGKSYDGLVKRVKDAGYSETYNSYYSGSSDFKFAKGGNRKLDDSNDDCTYVKLPMQHTGSELKYNEETGTYDYYVYGDPHTDPLDGDKILSFKNVILQKADFTQLDDHGYLIYNIIVGEPWDGYYCTNGKCEEIMWAKVAEEGNTYYSVKDSGDPLEINTGKTYICLVPDDQWNDIVIK
ncbi:MAG: DUF3048 domain-containing protein [Lachnospiraceae bacterium]|nr:DUF3048 domain-containing protein [Lachnospiraceae bacterium]